MTSIILNYFQHVVWPGLGLFGESYVLFSVGLLEPLWKILSNNSNDYRDDEDHDSSTNNANFSSEMAQISQMTISGVILGMMSLGYAADIIGRRRGSLLTALCMSMGAIGLWIVSIWNNEHKFQSMKYLFFLFGIGVGGEYPLAAVSASETTMQAPHTLSIQDGNERRDARTIDQDGMYVSMEETQSGGGNSYSSSSRGKHMQLVFSMQGAGIFFNALFLTFLLIMTQQTSNRYDHEQLKFIWMLLYAFGALVLTVVFATRFLFLQESKAWKYQQNTQSIELPSRKDATSSLHDAAPCLSSAPSNVSSASTTISELSTPSLAIPTQNEYEATNDQDYCDEDHTDTVYILLWRHYSMRLFGTSACWFLWDIAFYGNKLFQSTFLLAIMGNSQGEGPTLLAFAITATINAFCALLGYLVAAFVVDKLGRQRLQQYGFLLVGCLFCLCGLLMDTEGDEEKVTSNRNKASILLYLLSSFMGQVGPNATTFLLPAEIFPTRIRSLCHGISAASGKMGALVAAFFFPSLESELKMLMVCGYASLVAAALTSYLIPECNGLSLDEVDQKWRYIHAGRAHDYRGPANHPSFLSYCERHRRLLRTKNDNVSILDYGDGGS